MYPLDELFNQFIRELENLGQAVGKIRNYQRCFYCFKRLMAKEDLENFNCEKIIEFAERLRKIKHWDIKRNEFVSVKPTVILNSINYLWSFFIWTNKQGRGVTLRNDNQSIKFVMEKLLFYSVYRIKYNLLLGHNLDEHLYLNSQINGINFELLIKQLNRRFDYYCHLSTPVFFKGLADYVKYISEKKFLLSLIIDKIISLEPKDFISNNTHCKEIENLAESYHHSDWGSWFNLEIVYLIIYKMKEMLHKFSEIPDAMNFLNNCYWEMRIIMNNNSPIKPVYFSRRCYHYDLIRIHNLLTELLECKFDSQEIPVNQSDRIIYKYHEYGIPSGELFIQGFNAISFTKNRAKVIQFYYLNKGNESYYSYQDFNEFSGSSKKLYSSNEFRLLIDSINHRVKMSTAGVIKQLLIKYQGTTKINETNRYRFIK